MAGSKARASTQEGSGVRGWGGILVAGAMVLAFVALPVGFILQLPLVLGLSIAGLVAGGIALSF